MVKCTLIDVIVEKDVFFPIHRTMSYLSRPIMLMFVGNDTNVY